MFASPRIRTSHLRILKLKLSPLSHHNDVKLPGMYVYNAGQTLYDRLSSEEQEKLKIVSISSYQILFKSYKYKSNIMNTDEFELQIRENLTRKELNMLRDNYEISMDIWTFGLLIFVAFTMTTLVVVHIVLAFLENPNLFSFIFQS